MACRATLANGAWAVASFPAWHAFRKALATAGAHQAELLAGILARNAGTEYGRRYGFGSIRSVQDYQRRVPPVVHAEIAGLIDRVAQGGKNILTAEPVRLLEPTSGSTAAVKWIPVTRSLRTQFLRGIGPWVFDLFGNRPALFGGPSYWSVSPRLSAAQQAPSCVPVGYDDDRSYLGPLGALLAPAMAVPCGVLALREIDRFRHATLCHLLAAEDLRMVSVWNPTYFTLLLESMKARWSELLADLRTGGEAFFAAEGGARSVPLKMPRNVARADRLARIGPEAYTAIWPRLRLVSCWTAAHAAAPAAELSRLLPGVEVQGKGLLATEAFVTLPFEGQELLAVRSHFFEFESDGRFHLAQDLSIGGRYSVVVTTGGGFYRYRLRDRVEVTGFRGTTPALRFVGKEDSVSDLRGEKISEGFAARVLESALEGSSPPAFAMLAAEAEERPPRYVLYVESGSPLPADLEERLEAALRENPHYALCVELGQLAPAGVFQVAGGARDSFLRRHAALGHAMGGVKPSPLSRLSGWADVFAGRRGGGGTRP